MCGIESEVRVRSIDDHEAAFQALPALPQDAGRVQLLVLRKGGGVHETPAEAELSPGEGLHGDRWADGKRNPDTQVTLMRKDVADLIRTSPEQPLHTPGDNVLVDLDLSEQSLPVGTRLRLGEALLEVSPEPHTGCKLFSERFGAPALAWINHKARRDRRLRGVNCRVIEGGRVRLDDAVTVVRA